METSWHSLVKRHQKGVGAIGLQQAIDALIDESNGAFKLLLPDLTDAHVLYLGDDSRDTAINLARSCRAVTALFASDQSLTVQLDKTRLRAPQENLELGRLEQMPLPFSDTAFDGVVIDTAPEFHPSEFLRDIRRLIKPSGWIFLKAKNRLSRDTFLDTCKNRQLHSLSGYKRLLHRIGFSRQQEFGFDQLNLGVDRIVELASSTQMHELARHGKLRHLPRWLYRLTMPSFGILAGVDALPASTLSRIITQAMTDMGAPVEHEIVSIEINRKGKFVVMLEAKKPQQHKVMLKIPLTENAAQHMHHNYAGLKCLRDALGGSGTTHLRWRFPDPLCSGHDQSTAYHVESCVPGSPFKKNNDDQKMASIVKQIEDALIALQQIPCPPSAQSRLTLAQQIDFIRTFIQQEKPDLLASFDRIASPILQDEREAGGARYFFKSDFSVSNTFIENDVVTGLIDLDFWGTSHNRLVDYADFVFSFTRTFYGHAYAEGLALINSSKLSSIGPFLNIERTVLALGGNEHEFKQASRIAWINSVCHILEFERTRLNSKRIELVLINPILMLAQLDQASGATH